MRTRCNYRRTVHLYVTLLRGINVGGNNVLPMQDFRDLLASLECEDVATYIQSGNAVFRHASGAEDLSGTISTAIANQYGFRPDVMVLPASNFSRIVAANPFPAEAAEPKCLHVWFLLEAASQVNTARIEKMLCNGEKYSIGDSAFYLYAPNGVGRSKLAANVEKCLGVQATARNWRTVSKIDAMLGAER